MNNKKTLSIILLFVLFYCSLVISRRAFLIVQVLEQGIKIPVNVSLVNTYPKICITLLILVVIILLILIIFIIRPKCKWFVFNLIFNLHVRKAMLKLFLFLIYKFPGYPEKWLKPFQWVTVHKKLISWVARINTLLLFIIFVRELFFNEQVIKYSLILFLCLSLINFVFFALFIFANILFFACPEAFNYTIGSTCNVQMLSDITFAEIDKELWKELINYLNHKTWRLIWKISPF